MFPLHNNYFKEASKKLILNIINYKQIRLKYSRYYPQIVIRKNISDHFSAQIATAG